MSDKTAAELGDEIFSLVQASQGGGFVSDGISALPTREAIFGTVRWHLKNTELAARIMRKWLKQYGEL